MIEIRERQINQVVNALDSDSSNLPFMTDDEIMEHVLGYRSGYVKGLGALPRGEARNRRVQASSSTSIQNSAVQQKLQQQELVINIQQQKIDKLMSFIMSKFDDFQMEEGEDINAS